MSLPSKTSAWRVVAKANVCATHATSRGQADQKLYEAALQGRLSAAGFHTRPSNLGHQNRTSCGFGPRRTKWVLAVQTYTPKWPRRPARRLSNRSWLPSEAGNCNSQDPMLNEDLPPSFQGQLPGGRSSDSARFAGSHRPKQRVLPGRTHRGFAASSRVPTLPTATGPVQ